MPSRVTSLTVDQRTSFSCESTNGDGVLQISEAEEALKFLSDGKPVTVALPVTEGQGGEKHVSKLDFWLMFKAMMD